MPRRVYTYPESLGLGFNNMLSTIGSFVLAVGFLMVLINVFHGRKKAMNAGDNPWNGDSLEWSTSSPPPNYAFARFPVIGHRSPLWNPRLESTIDPATKQAIDALTEAPTTWRATLITDSFYASPQAIAYLPRFSLMPIASSLALLASCIGVLAKAYILAAMGMLLFVLLVVIWLLPKEDVKKLILESGVEEKTGLTAFPEKQSSTVWWGMVCWVIVTAVVFGSLFFSYYFIRLHSDQWPQDTLSLPNIWSGAGLLLLICAAASGHILALRAKLLGRKNLTVAGYSGSLLLTVFSLTFIFSYLAQLDFSPQTNAYASAFYIILGLLAIYLVPLLLMTGHIILRSMKQFGEQRGNFALLQQLLSLYWLSTIVKSFLVIAVIYLSPYLI